MRLPHENIANKLWHLLYVLQRIDFLQEQEFTVDGEIQLAPAQPLPGLDIIQEEGKLVCTLPNILEHFHQSH